MNLLSKIILDRDEFVKALGDKADHPDVVKLLSRDKDELLDDAACYYFAKKHKVLIKRPETYGRLTKHLQCELDEIIKLMRL